MVNNIETIKGSTEDRIQQILNVYHIYNKTIYYNEKI